MLFDERNKLILDILDKEEFVKTVDLIERLNASEATIRRNLKDLEDSNKIVRVHGGARKKDINKDEKSFKEKSTKNLEEKQIIGKRASEIVRDDDFIYLDAGTTTFEMIPYLENKNITVVTNGLTHLERLMEYKINTYLIGGYVKETTRALIGSIALSNLEKVNFSKAFIGVNGIDIKFGYTTPDVEEAKLKSKAMENSIESYVLADFSKFNKVYFSKIKELNKGVIITGKNNLENKNYYEKTKIIGA